MSGPDFSDVILDHQMPADTFGVDGDPTLFRRIAHSHGPVPPGRSAVIQGGEFPVDPADQIDRFGFAVQDFPAADINQHQLHENPP